MKTKIDDFAVGRASQPRPHALPPSVRARERFYSVKNIKAPLQTELAHSRAVIGISTLKTALAARPRATVSRPPVSFGEVAELALICASHSNALEYLESRSLEQMVVIFNDPDLWFVFEREFRESAEQFLRDDLDTGMQQEEASSPDVAEGKTTAFQATVSG